MTESHDSRNMARNLGQAGGIARAKRLAPEERSEIARKAAITRWSGTTPKNNVSESKPPHPLIVDATSGLCRYVTNADIRRMETICKAYEQIIQDARQAVDRADALAKRLSSQKYKPCA